MNNAADIKALAVFLNRANKNTYANKNMLKIAPSRLKSEDYHFEEGDWAYHDTYFGARDFIGEEIVYKAGKPVWGMNYFGRKTDDTASEKDVYDFLREALMQEHDGIIPVRGPKKFDVSDKKYVFVVDGDLANFSGKEEISFAGKIIYRCFVHGGFIR